MQTKEMKERVIVPEELRKKLGVSEDEIFELEKIGENQVILKTTGREERREKIELPKELGQKLNSIGIKSENIQPIRTLGKDYTMIMLKLPKENAEV